MKLKSASLLDYALFMECKSSPNDNVRKAVNRDAPFWAKGGKVINHGEFIMSHEYDSVDVVPLVSYEAADSSLKPGKDIIIGGLSFTVISIGLALCNESIGQQCYNYEETADMRYVTSDLKLVVDDWFNFFIEDSLVLIRETKEDEEEMIRTSYKGEDLYTIVPMYEVPGRFCVINASGEVRHSARGYGFLSKESATRFINRWVKEHPVPVCDIIALETSLLFRDDD